MEPIVISEESILLMLWTPEILLLAGAWILSLILGKD